jgi:precorrin-2 dehydrogenase / sirohydrochlorin ferrochelatase
MTTERNVNPVNYPVILDLRGRPVLMVGAGPIAARKVQGLLAAGAVVTVVAPQVSSDVEALGLPAERVHRRDYEPTDLDGQQLVMTATDVPAVNAAVAVDAMARGIWVNSADDPANCSFILPAIHRQGDITVAVSTGGAAPALAQYVRDRIAELIGPRYARAATILRSQRDAMHAGGETTEGKDWRPDIERALADE